MARRARMYNAIATMAADSEFTPTAHNLCCLRGISTLTGFALAVELGDRDRFTGASIGVFLGLVPCEHTSGDSRRQGGITKAGNSHVRRLLVESSWHHRPRYTVGKTLQARWDKAPAAGTVYSQRKKKHTVATTAIARELAGWSLATLPNDAM